MRVVCINAERSDNMLIKGKIYEVTGNSSDELRRDYYSLKNMNSAWHQHRFKIVSFKRYLELL